MDGPIALSTVMAPNSETYVIFGEAMIEDLSSQLQTQAAQRFRMPDMGSVISKGLQRKEAVSFFLCN
ncbi:hypothetical protein L1987_18696 [Smallanthus sonchifolius]|uniref:Uncharacterized protein n=1 Tax=Smallanthus sonchifolius TaxID=185202 RepID=A0ACB9J112_9ASTR|nr:hypothetical protein L1987_18696 [Smallanthus sonchifolius]